MCSNAEKPSGVSNSARTSTYRDVTVAYADLHGILIASHGVLDGLFGLAAHIQVAATLPRNYIAWNTRRLPPMTRLPRHDCSKGTIVRIKGVVRTDSR